MLSKPSSPQHIFELLEDAAAAGNDNGLLFLDRGWSEAPSRVTYAELYEQAKINGSRLVNAGIVEKGSIAITYFETHWENVLWFWSVTAAGGICAVLNPVSNEPKTAAGQLDNLKSLFGDAPVLTTHKLSAFFASRKLNVKTVEQIDKRKSDNGAISSGLSKISRDDIAAILFTSGSTGHSKAVQYSQAQLIRSVEAKSSHLSTYDKTFMSWISFDHSACFCEVHLQAIYNGTDQVFLPTSDLVLEPYRFFHVLSQYKIGYTFSPNFFLAVAAKSLESQPDGVDGVDLSHLSVIMCGGEANRTTTLHATDRILRQCGAPPHTIKAAYGLSETCSACYYNLESPDYDVRNGNTFASVGKHLPGVMEVKIVSREDDDQANPDEGLVFVRGDVIFKGYYNNPTATAACMTDDGWMNTGDIGRIDAEGNLHLLGRQKEVLVLNGNNYSSFEIEYALETAGISGLEVSYTAAFSTWDQERNSEAVVILFNPTEAAIGPKNMRATLQAIDKCVFTVCAQKPLHVISLPKVLMPKSTIGKLSRAKLKQSFETGGFNDYILGLDQAANAASDQKTTNGARSLDSLPPLQREIAQIYAGIVNVPPEDLIGPDALLSSGINSLGFMRLKKALEKGLKIHQEIPMPLLLRCHSLADLEYELTLLGTVSQQYDPIVPLATEGSKQPLFLLHPGAGEFLCWIGLLKYLPDRPIYALRARGLHPGEGTFDGLQDLLDTYYQAIRRVQPKGPYAFLGYCFGGLLCFELAKMFEEAGESIVFCGGIDNPPNLKVTMGQVQYRTLMFEVLPVVTDMTEAESNSFKEETAHLSDEEFYEVLFTKFSPEFIENMDLTVPRLQAFGRVEDCMRLIVDKYEPSGQVSTTDIFRADPMPHFGSTPEVWKSEVLGGWRGFVKDENVAFHDVPGTHISLIKEPLIADFQRTLNEALEKRGV
ncbi:hypothetical protein M409DRAFT_24081 [Zasmidium cellare ATCC 36951]|uniref:Carrier domain-containing protein n=1 Tax=Zasmidium cellare ATCC 36951 TaxID=1080233 RepID=A0A6A6CEZ7_ZASCE|nr:uncharacterized protein M409DRAFT_24081 [Zasmidium cellare ATCC 36951]KAF2165794.1 hypothetical protein M409DRAFT_24081 [Zasmidium cellare ATCC 36951]